MKVKSARIVEVLMGERAVAWPPLSRLIQRTRALAVAAAEKSPAVRHILSCLKQVARYRSDQVYSRWIESFDTLAEGDRVLIRRHVDALEYKPLFSLMVSLHDCHELLLRHCLDSVVGQLYPHWELCIAYDDSLKDSCRSILHEYAQGDHRIKVSCRRKKGAIADAMNVLLEESDGEYFALLEQHDTLSEHSLYMVAVELNKNRLADLIYTDEDSIDANDRRCDPHFKPDWNPDLFYSHNVIGRLAVFRTSLVRDLGGFRPACDSCLAYDLALRVAAGRASQGMRHIPFILYHHRSVSGSATGGEMRNKHHGPPASCLALQNVLEGSGVRAKIEVSEGDRLHRVVYPLPQQMPAVSIIVPTAGSNLDGLAKLVEGILYRTDYPDVELILIPNNIECDMSMQYLQSISMETRVRLIPYNGPFNFSIIYNDTVPKATGELIGILNDDLDVISSGWLKEMVSHALRKEIGAVGAMLYYKDDTIQHAGLILGLGGVAAHVYKRYYRGSCGYFDRARLIQNYSAVTAACMVMRREVFTEVGGFDPNLGVAYNDVDLCLRIWEKGYRILWTPYAELYHLESASRGPDDAPHTLPRFLREVEYMRTKWGGTLSNDVFYSPNLSQSGRPFELSFPPRVSKPWLAIDAGL